MLGDRRPFPIMLVVPNAEPLKAWAARHGLPADDMERLVQAAGGAHQARARGAEDAPRPRPVRDAQEVPAVAAGFQRGRRRAHADAQGAAADRGGAAQGGHRGALRRAASRADARACRLSAAPGADPDPPRARHQVDQLRRSGSGPSPTTRSPGSTTRAASRTHAGSPPYGGPEHHTPHRAGLERQPSAAQHADPRLVHHLGRRIDRHQSHAGHQRRHVAPRGRRRAHQHEVAARPAETHQRRQRLRGRARRARRPRRATARRPCPARRPRSANRRSHTGQPSVPVRTERPSTCVGQQHQKRLVVIGGTAQMIGELDEHQGLNTTQVSLPASTVTLR